MVRSTPRAGAVPVALAVFAVVGALAAGTLPLLWICLALGWVGSLVLVAGVAAVCVAWVRFAAARR